AGGCSIGPGWSSKLLGSEDLGDFGSDVAQLGEGRSSGTAAGGRGQGGQRRADGDSAPESGTGQGADGARHPKKPSRNAAACGDRNCRALSWLRKGAAVHFLVASDPVKKHGPWVVADLRVVMSLGDPV